MKTNMSNDQLAPLVEFYAVSTNSRIQSQRATGIFERYPVIIKSAPSADFWLDRGAHIGIRVDESFFRSRGVETT